MSCENFILKSQNIIILILFGVCKSWILGKFLCFKGYKALRLTSECWPAERVLLHSAHLRQGRCQSFPREVTRSAKLR